MHVLIIVLHNKADFFLSFALCKILRTETDDIATQFSPRKKQPPSELCAIENLCTETDDTVTKISPRKKQPPSEHCAIENLCTETDDTVTKISPHKKQSFSELYNTRYIQATIYA